MRAQDLHPSSIPITVLYLSSQTSQVLRREGAQIPKKVEFALGVDVLAAKSFRYAPPRPIEIEHAIELTEEVVMPLAKQFAGGGHLQLQGLGAVLIASCLSAVDASEQLLLNMDEVEAIFNRLVLVSEGRPSTQETLPTDVRFFASMLILREFMHHLRFNQVAIQTVDQGPQQSVR